MSEEVKTPNVCLAIQTIADRAAEKAAARAAEEAAANTMAVANRMLRAGKLTVEEIAGYLGISVDEVKALEAAQKNN